MMGFSLFDERTGPPLRARIGGLLAAGHDASFALDRIRLAVLDLTDSELTGLRRCRVLLGHLDASTLLDATDVGGQRTRPDLGPLLRFMDRGRLEIRSAGLAGWNPDFAVVRGSNSAVGVLGTIRFGGLETHAGPGFTAVVTDPAATGLLQRRFDELWEVSHDVLPAVRPVLEG